MFQEIFPAEHVYKKMQKKNLHALLTGSIESVTISDCQLNLFLATASTIHAVAFQVGVM